MTTCINHRENVTAILVHIGFNNLAFSCVCLAGGGAPQLLVAVPRNNGQMGNED